MRVESRKARKGITMALSFQGKADTVQLDKRGWYFQAEETGYALTQKHERAHVQRKQQMV